MPSRPDINWGWKSLRFKLHRPEKTPFKNVGVIIWLVIICIQDFATTNMK